MIKKITVILFLVFIFGMFAANIIKPPTEFSISERRRLAQFDGVFDDGFDDYTVDQTVFREEFRRIKAFFDLRVLRKSDNNDIFVHNGQVFKIDYPLNERNVLRLCGIINTMNERYLDESNRVFYSVAPDKNVFIEDSRFLVMDYDEMKDLIHENVDDSLEYIEIFDELSLDSFYRTDSHWRQEFLLPVADTLAEGMGVELRQRSLDDFNLNNFDSFFGVYYGHSALNMPPDDLIWLTDKITENAVVTNVEKPSETFDVYDVSMLESADSYNMFLCGSVSVVTVENPANKGGRNLIIFRDSFASPLAPLLLEAYSSITLIDLRYVHPAMLDEFVEFEGADVLFLYSAGLFNNSDSVRGN